MFYLNIQIVTHYSALLLFLVTKANAHFYIEYWLLHMFIKKKKKGSFTKSCRRLSITAELVCFIKNSSYSF